MLLYSLKEPRIIFDARVIIKMFFFQEKTRFINKFYSSLQFAERCFCIRVESVFPKVLEEYKND